MARKLISCNFKKYIFYFILFLFTNVSPAILQSHYSPEGSDKLADQPIEKDEEEEAEAAE